MAWSTTLTEAITADATLLPVAAPSPNGRADFLIRVDAETMKVVGRGHKLTWSVQRGLLGTTPAAHNAGATVALAWVPVVTTPGVAGSGGGSGPQGEQGPPGPQGEQGEQGPQGIQGPPGADGADGADGAAGATGSQGLTGATGAKGDKGDKGDTGDQGPQGIQGIQGIPGADGQDGADGADGASLPAGIIAMWGGLVSAIPSGWVLCNGANGTPDLRDRFVKGAANGQNPGATGGAATHGHTVTQPSDHAALTHSGAAVAAHNVTQPSAHSDHAAQAHSAHSGATVGNHTDVTNHVHVEQLQGGTTGTTSGTHLMGSASTGGSLRSAGQSTLNPTSVGTAAMVHTVGQASAHSDHAALSHSAHSGTAVDAHGVTQPSQHAAQSHSGAAVNTVNNEPAYYALCFIQKT